MALTGADSGLFNVYSASAAWSSSPRCTPFPTSSCSPASALDLVSSEMEDAANILGAGTLRTIFRVITLPLVTAGDPRRRDHRRSWTPIALFGTPALIALPARFNVVTHAALAVLRIPGAGRGGGGLRDAAARSSPSCCSGCSAGCSAARATWR